MFILPSCRHVGPRHVLVPAPPATGRLFDVIDNTPEGGGEVSDEEYLRLYDEAVGAMAAPQPSG